MSLEKRLKVIDLGTMEYSEVLKIQERFVEERSKDEIDDTLILVEHPPIITMGARGKSEQIRASEEDLKRSGIDICVVGRGGSTFLHNPGQVVGYPIRLADPNSKRNYMILLQQTMIDVAQSYEVNAVTHPKKAYVGAWYELEKNLFYKIGAIGVQFKFLNERYITMHGFAFNVNNDTSLFQKIEMCGCKLETCISLKDILGKELPMDEVKAKLLAQLSKNLGYSTTKGYRKVKEMLPGGLLV